MSTSYISFAHVMSESADHYYLALPGHYSIGSEYDRAVVLEHTARLTGEDADLLYVECLDSVSVGLNDVTLL